jgi:hypothetical protein
MTRATTGAVTLLGLLGGCAGGPLSGVRLQSFIEAQRHALATMTIPSLDQADQVVRSWPSAGAELAPLAHLVLGLHGIPAEAADAAATGSPIGLALSRADRPGPQGPVPTEVAAISFALDDPAAARQWIGRVGDVDAHTDELYRARRSAPVEVGRDLLRRSVTVAGGTLWFHVDRDEVIVSDSQLGLELAGPAARAARRHGGEEISLRVFPQVWAPSQRHRLAARLARLLTHLKRGRDPGQGSAAATGSMLRTVDALVLLRPFISATVASFALRLDAAGATLRVSSDGRAPEAALVPVLDPALATQRAPAAIGALDCREPVLTRQRALAAAWKARGGQGADELLRLVEVETQVLAGSCSFAVHTDDELLDEVASYPLRAGAAGDELGEALVSAIRSGGLPSLGSALLDLSNARLFFERKDDGVLALNRVLGAAERLETRHAAALSGTPVLRDRFAIKDGRLLAASGAGADQRIEQLAATPGAAAPLPAELQRALAGGRGKGGFLFADLTALWTPYLKAAQAVTSPLAELVSRRPALLKERRPLVVTMEPAAGFKATVTMPPQTFEFVTVWGVYLLAP